MRCEELGAEDVEVEVRNVSLNFRDVLNVLGMYPGDPGDPGGEFAGVVTRLGSGVSDLSVGDRVVGMRGGTLKQVLACPRLLLHRCPQLMSLAACATLPVVYCTVELGLGDLAGLKAGETVLIHAAAGGVGMVAIQYAQRIGARIIATASDGKRGVLRELGVELVASSRDADKFEGELRQLLGPEGSVDVVLNSLSGDFIAHSVRALSSGGRFVEIGKRGIWSAEDMARARPDVAYHVVALDTLGETQPQRFQELLHRVCLGVDQSHWRALPLTVYDFHREYKRAFRMLRDGKNIGKVVLSMAPVEKREALTVGEGAYVVTGGLGGLGLVTARAVR